MKFWWVSQNRTWKQEIEGGYMWSPQLASNGKHIIHYDNMKLVESGDVIFSYYNQEIGSIGIATGGAYEAIKPAEFGTDGDDWDKKGWMVNVKYKELSFPISPKSFFSELQEVLPKKYYHLITMVVDIRAICLAFQETWLQYYLAILLLISFLKKIINKDKHYAQHIHNIK